MAVEFYLNDIRCYPQCNSTLIQKVGTFDCGVLEMQFSNIESPIAPMSALKVVDTTNNSTWNFVITADSVEIVKKTKPLMYKHTLTLSQNTYKLTKHILRNSVFTQPRETFVGKTNLCVCDNGATNNLSMALYVDQDQKPYSSISVSLNRRCRIKTAILKVHTDLYVFNSEATSTTSGNTTTRYYNIGSTTYKNQHTSLPVDIKRYDNGTLVNTLSLTLTNHQTELVLDTTQSIFQNITNGTIIKIEPRHVFHTFDFDSSVASRKGSLAIINYELETKIYYYSLYDVINTILKQANKGYNGQYSFNIFQMPTVNSATGTELDSIIAPEFNFTGKDVYSAVNEVLSYIDAIPTIDENNVLGFEYLNDQSREPISLSISDKKTSINEQNYTNKLSTNYQNGKQEAPIIYPAENKYTLVTTKNYGVPSSSDYVLKVAKPIDYIDKVYLRSSSDIKVANFRFYRYTDSSTQRTLKFENIPYEDNVVDISTQVVSSEILNSLNVTAYAYDGYQTDNNCVYYTRGGTQIDLRGNATTSSLAQELWQYVVYAATRFHFGIEAGNFSVSGTSRNITFGALPNKQDLLYQVQYHAILDGRAEETSQDKKYNGDSYVNSYTNPQLERMGNNLQGLIAKLGNEVKNVFLDVTSYGSRMTTGTLWKDDDGNRYIANTVKTTFSTSSDRVLVEAEFSKNFNIISQYTKLDQEKRFYEISESITSKGYETLTEYVYFGYSLPTAQEKTALGTPALNLTEYIYNRIIWYSIKHQIGSYGSLYSTIKTYDNELDSVAIQENNEVYLPMHIYGLGNSICFEMDFDSPINAGERTTYTVEDGRTIYKTNTTLYTSSNGFADKVEIKCYDSGTSKANYSTRNFPLILNNELDSTKYFTITYNYYKKPNEIFHLNYQLAFLYKDEEIFFGDKFINENCMIQKPTEQWQTYLYYGDEQYSILDNKALSSHNHISATVSGSRTNDYYTLTIRPLSTISCKAWALCNQYGEIILSSNKVLSNEDEITLYVFCGRNRI